jgi:hypothetical protein
LREAGKRRSSKALPPEFDIEANGDDGLTFTLPADSVKIALKLDGKPCAIEGPRVPPGMTSSAKSSGPRKITATTNLKDKMIDTEIWEVSADGKTFTYTEQDPGEAKPIVAIYDRI